VRRQTPFSLESSRMPTFDIDAIRGLIIDMDGVLWRGAQPVGDLPAVFERLRRFGLQFTLATNNATLSPGQYAEKLRSFGVELDEAHIINSAQAAARLAARAFPQGGPVYIVGENGLVQALDEQGFYHSESDVLAVVAGLDRSLTYEKLRRAALFLRSGAAFFGTNPDLTYPAPGGELEPGAGTILAALEAASGIKPVTAGKPEPGMYQVAMERMRTEPSETLVIGDRLDTDISGAQALGCPTALVLSGVSTREEARAWQPPVDVVAEDITSLWDLLFVR
jgi:4-nitrophenyl phosphatase